HSVDRSVAVHGRLQLRTCRQRLFQFFNRQLEAVSAHLHHRLMRSSSQPGRRRNRCESLVADDSNLHAFSAIGFEDQGSHARVEKVSELEFLLWFLKHGMRRQVNILQPPTNAPKFLIWNHEYNYIGYRLAFRICAFAGMHAFGPVDGNNWIHLAQVASEFLEIWDQFRR